MTTVTEPGIYEMDDATYHADPVIGGSLSASGAKTILKAPALFNHQQTTGAKEHKDVFDFGTAAHGAILGTGAPLAVLDFRDWRASGAAAAKKDAYANGLTPILAKDMAVIAAMDDAVKRHPVATALLDASLGNAEQSVFWQEGGEWFRARPDFLDNEPREGRTDLICVDYKTTPDASVRGFEKSIVNFDYPLQAAHYSAGIEAVTGYPVTFLFLAQEKTAPYLVNVFSLSSELRQMGRERMDRAIQVWLECRASGEWPGYPERVHRADAPMWATYQHEEDLKKWVMTK